MLVLRAEWPGSNRWHLSDTPTNHRQSLFSRGRPDVSPGHIDISACNLHLICRRIWRRRMTWSRVHVFVSRPAADSPTSRISFRFRPACDARVRGRRQRGRRPRGRTRGAVYIRVYICICIYIYISISFTFIYIYIKKEIYRNQMQI